MEKIHKPAQLAGIKKRKRKISLTHPTSEPKNLKLAPSKPDLPEHFNIKTKAVDSKKKATKVTEDIKKVSEVKSPKKVKKAKVSTAESKDVNEEPPSSVIQVEPENEIGHKKKADVIKSPKTVPQKLSADELGEKYPILKNRDLIDKFLNVQMSNNQKGRIRQAIKLSLQGSSQTMFPDIIHGKIQAILNSSTDLTDSELRRIRILYNMLKTSLESPTELLEPTAPKKKKNNKNKDGTKEEKEKSEQKVKGPKRYVVFLGNLPLDINKEKIMEHFAELNENIKDIRLPIIQEGKKSAIAYVELTNEPSYELALSKHHSMLGNKRINVLYTAQKNGKISKSQAKSKSAKLIALQKSGKLVGSIPLNKKRSHRRAIMKKAQAKESETQ